MTDNEKMHYLLGYLRAKAEMMSEEFGKPIEYYEKELLTEALKKQKGR